MNGETRNDGKRCAEVDQPVAQRAVLECQGDSPGQRKIAVEPRIQQYATVDLRAELLIALCDNFRMGFEFETRTVSVRAHHTKPGIGERHGTQAKRNHRRPIARDPVASAALQLPGGALFQTFETCRVQRSGQVLGRMKGRRRLVEKGQQASVKLSLIHAAILAVALRMGVCHCDTRGPLERNHLPVTRSAV